MFQGLLEVEKERSRVGENPGTSDFVLQGRRTSEVMRFSGLNMRSFLSRSRASSEALGKISDRDLQWPR